MHTNNTNSNNSKKEILVGDYLIKNTLGRGTFGEVKLGINVKTNKKYAIKILEKRKILEKDDEIRVQRELEMLTSFNHPNVVKIYEIITTNTSFYIVMEFCSGGELFSYIVEKRRLLEKEASFFYYQLIKGLEYIHSKHVAHRDLKPENLLLTNSHKIKIIDFGLSNYFTNELLETPCGSPCYASPEMISGNKYDGFKIDIWSSGIILFAMICGYLPFEDRNNDILFKKILSGKLYYPDFVGKYSKDLMKKILVKYPNERITINEIKQHPFYLLGKKMFYLKFGKPKESDYYISSNTAIKTEASVDINDYDYSNTSKILQTEINTTRENKPFFKKKSNDSNNTKKNKTNEIYKPKLSINNKNKEKDIEKESIKVNEDKINEFILKSNKEKNKKSLNLKIPSTRLTNITQIFKSIKDNLKQKKRNFNLCSLNIKSDLISQQNTTRDKNQTSNRLKTCSNISKNKKKLLSKPKVTIKNYFNVNLGHCFLLTDAWFMQKTKNSISKPIKTERNKISQNKYIKVPMVQRLNSNTNNEYSQRLKTQENFDVNKQKIFNLVSNKKVVNKESSKSGKHCSLKTEICFFKNIKNNRTLPETRINSRRHTHNKKHIYSNKIDLFYNHEGRLNSNPNNTYSMNNTNNNLMFCTNSENSNHKSKTKNINYNILKQYMNKKSLLKKNKHNHSIYDNVLKYSKNNKKN